MFANVLLAFAIASTGQKVDQSGHGVVEVKSQYLAEAFEGFENRAEVEKAISKIGNGDSASAWEILRPVMKFCDALASDTTTVYASVLNSREAAILKQSHKGERPLVFVDIACPSAYKTAAFLYVDQRESEKAFEALQKAQDLAPLWADAHAERGYLLRVLKDFKNALSEYRIALDLSERFEGSAPAKAVALRGIGFTLTEMGDLSGARDAYERSLLVDPTNQTAKHELEYIDSLSGGAR